MFKKKNFGITIALGGVLTIAVAYLLLQNMSTSNYGDDTYNYEPMMKTESSYMGNITEDYYVDDYTMGMISEEMPMMVDSIVEDVDRMLIKTGSLSMKVDNLDETTGDIQQIVDGFDGYISNLYDYGVDNSRTVTATVRVPVDKFDTVVTQFKALAIEVVRFNQSSNDVTAEYVDLQARLTNKEAVEQQYVELLDKAVDVEDMLLIQEQLGFVRGEIESLKGQIKYYDAQTEYSTLDLSLSLSSEGTEVVDDSWDPLGTLKDAVDSFVGLLRASGDVIIWVVIFSPVVIIPWALIKVGKKKKK